MKKIIIALATIGLIALLIKKQNMSFRQSLLKAFYPVIMLKGKLFGNKNDTQFNTSNTLPKSSFYDLIATKNNGDSLHFSELKGKKVLIVNTASDCGFTAQYEELEKMHQLYGNQLVILGFPSNDFKEQEKKSDTEIAEFCKINYGVHFQLMQKTSVKESTAQHNVFKWLSHANQNGWCNQPPVWNFCKYLIDENGILRAYYSMMISPMDIKLGNFHDN